MTRQEAIDCIMAGIQIVDELVEHEEFFEPEILSRLSRRLVV